jgi:hypothetical protein
VAELSHASLAGKHRVQLANVLCFEDDTPRTSCHYVARVGGVVANKQALVLPQFAATSWSAYYASRLRAGSKKQASGAWLLLLFLSEPRPVQQQGRSKGAREEAE